MPMRFFAMYDSCMKSNLEVEFRSWCQPSAAKAGPRHSGKPTILSVARPCSKHGGNGCEGEFLETTEAAASPFAIFEGGHSTANTERFPVSLQLARQEAGTAAVHRGTLQRHHGGYPHAEDDRRHSAVPAPPCGCARSEERSQAADWQKFLHQQLKATHTNKDRFVPANIAVQGLTAEQASWADGHGNHSIGKLAYHLAFCNAQELAIFKGETPAKYGEKNHETFSRFDEKQWSETVQQLDQVMLDLEKYVEPADEKGLDKNGSMIATLAMHDAYHIRQIIYIRRLQGSWKTEMGVK
jgi:hypothetical protein